MPSNQQIEQLLLSNLQEQEPLRQTALKKMRLLLVAIMLVTVVMVAIFVAWFYYAEDPGLPFLAFTVLLITVSITHQPFLKKRETYIKEFEAAVKTRVHEQVFKAWNHSIQYAPDKYIALEEYKQAALFPLGVYTGDDYVEGTLPDGRAFRFSELRVHAVDERDPQNVKEMFKGFFLVIENTLPAADFNQYLKLQSLSIQEYNQQQQLQKKHLARLEKERQKAVEVLDSDLLNSNSQQALLSPFEQLYKWEGALAASEDIPKALREELQLLRTRFQKQISLSFQEGRVYITIAQATNNWAIDPKHSLENPPRLRYWVHSFQTIFNLVERLAKVTHSTL